MSFVFVFVCIGVKEDSSLVTPCPDDFAVYLHLPYTGHTCFFFEQEDERDHFLSALKTCIRHQNLGMYCMQTEQFTIQCLKCCSFRLSHSASSQEARKGHKLTILNFVKWKLYKSNNCCLYNSKINRYCVLKRCHLSNSLLQLVMWCLLPQWQIKILMCWLPVWLARIQNSRLWKHDMSSLHNH